MKQVPSDSIVTAFIVFDSEALPTTTETGGMIGIDSIARRVNTTTKQTTNYYQYDGVNWNEV